MERERTDAYFLRAAFAVALIAVLAYGWVCALAFQIDDYYLIPKAPCFLKSLGSMLLDPAHMVTGGPPLLDPSEHPHFQPTLWALLATLTPLSGEPLRAPLFHGAILLLHAAASVALLRLLSRFLPLGAATVGAIFFAILPAGAQSASWISAGSHVLAVLFGVLALDTLLRPSKGPYRHFGRAILAGDFMALAFLSHVEALAWILLGLLVLLQQRAQLGVRIASAVMYLAPLLVVWFVRTRFLGSWSFGYKGQIQPGMEALRSMEFLGLPGIALQMTVPWNRQASVADIAPIAQSLAPRAVWFLPFALLLLLLAARCVMRPSTLSSPSAESTRTTKHLLVGLLLAFGLILGPALFSSSLYHMDPDNRGSRALYSPAAPMAAILAFACAVLLRGPGPRIRAMTRILLVLIFAICGDALYHVAQTELRAASFITTRQVQILRASEEAPPGTTLLVVDSQSTYAGIPLIGPDLLPSLVRPPFADRPVAVIVAPWLTDLVENRTLLTTDGPMQILQWEGNGYRVLAEDVPARASIPPLLSAPVPEEMASTAAMRWTPKSQVSARSIAGLRVRLKPGPSQAVTVLLRAEGVNRYVETRAAEDDSELFFLLDEDFEWLTAKAFVDVLVMGDRVAHTADDPPELLKEFDATLSLRVGGSRTAFSMGEEIPLQTDALPAEGRLHLTVRFGLEEAEYRMQYTADLKAMPASSKNSASFTTADLTFESGTYILAATATSKREPASLRRLPELFEQVLAPYGIHALNASVRLVLEHPGANPRLPRARSAWIPIRFDAPTVARRP
jgi:hypothetical protein